MSGQIEYIGSVAIVYVQYLTSLELQLLSQSNMIIHVILTLQKVRDDNENKIR